MPTDAEWAELRDNCTRTRTTLNGVNGVLFIANNGNSIFLPAAGIWLDTRHVEMGTNGYYWSSSLDSVNPTSAWGLYIDGSIVSRDCYYSRCRGVSVRAVSK